MIKICGRSDDHVNVYEMEDGKERRAGVGGQVDDEDVLLRVGTAEVGLYVRVRYAEFLPQGGQVGCWSAAILQLDEDVPIPWGVRIRADSEVNNIGRSGAVGFGAVVLIDAPLGTPVQTPDLETGEWGDVQ